MPKSCLGIGRLKSVLVKRRILELGQLSFYVLSKCLTFPRLSLCSKPSTRLPCWNSRVVCIQLLCEGKKENWESSSLLGPRAQRRSVKGILGLCIREKRLCWVTWGLVHFLGEGSRSSWKLPCFHSIMNTLLGATFFSEYFYCGHIEL